VSEPARSRPHVLLSCAMSVDGHIDDASPDRLILSDEEDLDRVDAERAASDAILVGANTLRRDDPRLLVRSAERRALRERAGLPASPLKVTVTRRADLDPRLRFFAPGGAAKVVYAPASKVEALAERLGGVAEVRAGGEEVDLGWLLDDLAARGVGRLMVEGGEAVHTAFLTAGLADELQLVVAPFFVGDGGAPRLVGPGRFPHDARSPMRLEEVRRIGQVVLLRYRLT
jgi:5-amino-6-(5-phosphoribosylamino)uracil reductase